MSDDAARARQRGYERAYQERRRDEINARNRGDNVSPERREEKRAYTRQYREADPEKLREQRNAYKERHPDQDREWYLRNRDEINERRRVWRKENPEAAREQDRKADSQRKQRLKPRTPPEEWAAMWEAQAGRCYLCGNPLVAGKTHVDHDYSCCPRQRTCQVCRRGIACGPCNMAIGLAGDDPDRLRRMADALEAAKDAVRERMAAAASGQLQLPETA